MATAPELDFARDGLTVLRRGFDATGMEAAFWAVLGSRFQIDRDDRATWPAGAFGKLTRWGRSGPFSAVQTPAVDDAITTVLDTRWHLPQRWGGPLVTFPAPGPWQVPRTSWHSDFPPEAPLTAVRMFAFAAPVEATGGGTLVVTGSHRLAEQHGGRSRELRTALAERSPWFRDLWRSPDDDDRTRRFLEDGAEVDGVAVRVVELTGEAGDVVLWHPSILHAMAPNARARPRFMLTNTAFRLPA